MTETTIKSIESKVALYPNFPQHGVLFRDIMPILNDPVIFGQLIDALCDQLKGLSYDRVLGIESRGFLIGPPIAQKMQKPFSAIRKKGKLPGAVHAYEYEKEYGKDVLEIQRDALPMGSKCVIVDDLIATGGSMQAAMKLIEMNGSEVVACLVIIELKSLKGVDKLENKKLLCLFSY